MTPVEFANKYGLRVVEPGCGEERQIEGAYCGDLLSMVMGRAKENDAFVSVSLPEEGMFLRGRRRLFDERACPGMAVQVRVGKVNPLYNEISILEAVTSE